MRGRSIIRSPIGRRKNNLSVLLIPNAGTCGAKLRDRVNCAARGFSLPGTVIKLRWLRRIVRKKYLRFALSHNLNAYKRTICPAMCESTCTCEQDCGFSVERKTELRVCESKHEKRNATAPSNRLTRAVIYSVRKAHGDCNGKRDRQKSQDFRWNARVSLDTVVPHGLGQKCASQTEHGQRFNVCAALRLRRGSRAIQRRHRPHILHIRFQPIIHLP